MNKNNEVLSKYGRRWLNLYKMEESAENVINRQTGITEKDLRILYRKINNWVEKRSELEPFLTPLDKELISNECACPMFDY